MLNNFRLSGMALALIALISVSACRGEPTAAPEVSTDPEVAAVPTDPPTEPPAEEEEETAGSFFVSAEAVDDYTVRLTLNRPNAPLLQTLAMGNFGFSSPAAIEASGDSYGTPDGDPIGVGTGPYQVSEWEPSERVNLTAFADYWGDAPASAEIEFKVIPDNSARYLALASGEIDGMNQVNPEDIEAANAEEAVNVVFEPANNVGYLGFNQAKAPWGNMDCRMAVAQAIDKQGIVDALYAGDAETASNMMPPKLWGYNSEITDYGYDLEAAQASMDSCLESETLPDEVVFYVPPIARFYYPKPKELGEFIQASLAQLGINTKIESPDWRSIWLPDVREGKADLFLLGWGGDNGDPDNFLCQFFCGGDSSFNSDAEGNPAPPNMELNNLLREAATLNDQDTRRAAYEAANQIVHDNVIAVPLVHRSPPLLFAADAEGYVSSPIQTILTNTGVGGSDRLVFGHPEDASFLDPAYVTDGESLLVTWHIYEGLTRYQAGSTEIEPGLATEWTVSEDGLVWDFTLREGVTFHDGTAFNADAVVWNFDRWFDESNEYHFEDKDFAYWSYMFQGFKN